MKDQTIPEIIDKGIADIILQFKKEEHCDGCDGWKKSEECSVCKPHFDRIRKKANILKKAITQKIEDVLNLQGFSGVWSLSQLEFIQNKKKELLGDGK